MEVWILALGTLIVVAAIAIWQRRSASKAKDERQHSAMTQGRPEQRSSDGRDPGTKPQGAAGNSTS